MTQHIEVTQYLRERGTRKVMVNINSIIAFFSVHEDYESHLSGNKPKTHLEIFVGYDEENREDIWRLSCMESYSTVKKKISTIKFDQQFRKIRAESFSNYDYQ